MSLIHLVLAASQGATNSPLDYGSALHSFVNAWLESEATKKDGDISIAPWPEWSLPEGSLRSLLPLPAPVVHHPWSGCRASPICYPSPAFLKEVIWGALADEGSGGTSAFVIVELGCFLGEASVGLAQSLEALKLNGTVFAVDTWHEHHGYVGPYMFPQTYNPPDVAADQARLQHEELSSAGRSVLFEQYVRNVNATGHSTRSHVFPVPLMAPGMQADATRLGKMGIRPVLIYINANQRAERMRHDLQQAWRLLACGGTLFGAGYHLNRAEIDDFRLKIAGNLGSFEAHVVHAPGALKFENISLEYSWESMLAHTKSNFSTWVIHRKRCARTVMARD